MKLHTVVLLSIAVAFSCSLLGLHGTNAYGIWALNFSYYYFQSNPIPLHNWGGNFNYSTLNVQYPSTVAQVQRIVRAARSLRVLAQRHSFSRIADSPDTILSTLALNDIVGFNDTVPSVTVQAGITYADLAPILHEKGYALPNLAALAEISVGGAISTGVHGSGLQLQTLAAHVRSAQLVLANGTLAEFGPGDPQLKAVSVALGSLGVLTQLELKLEPAYDIINYVYLNMSMADELDHFDAIQQSGYSVYLYVWPGQSIMFGRVRISVRSDSNHSAALLRGRKTLYGAQQAPISAGITQPDVGIGGPWFRNLLHYPVGQSGNDGDEGQSEYYVHYGNAVAAIRSLNAVYAQIASILAVFVVRTVRGDDLWMSPFHGSDATFVALHFSWRNDGSAISSALAVVERALTPYGALPHWGKMYAMGGCQILSHYPLASAFKELAQKRDTELK